MQFKIFIIACILVFYCVKMILKVSVKQSGKFYIRIVYQKEHGFCCEVKVKDFEK